jgi:hypothetical protein
MIAINAFYKCLGAKLTEAQEKKVKDFYNSFSFFTKLKLRIACKIINRLKK